MSTGSLTGTGASSLGMVVIGRNEGERLRRCLESLQGMGPVVYVDSGSTDGSAFTARSLGAYVVELDLSIPFTAARARNAGAEKLLDLHPGTAYIQFVDGDCEIVAGWIQHAIGIMEARPEVAALSGRIREKNPQNSIYNRLADLEWDRPTGEAESCMGLVMMRVSSFRHVGGFDPTIAAGEEAELCCRLRARDYKVGQVPETMALHDMAMLEFSQWWRRMVRGGYASWDVYERTGSESAGARLRSARIWGAGWPFVFILACMTALFLPWWAGVPLIAGTLMLGPVQAIRIAMMARERGMEWGDAWMHGLLMMIGKWAALKGQWLYMVDRENGQATRLIEHKNVDASVPKPGFAGVPQPPAISPAESELASRWAGYNGPQWRG